MKTTRVTQVAWLRSFFMVGVIAAMLAFVGCQTIPVRTYDESTSDATAATLELVSGESFFWRMGQDAVVNSIDGNSDHKWAETKTFKMLPGKHTMHISYYAVAGGGKYWSTTWHNIFDEQDVAFELIAGRSYQLTYTVKQWPTPHDLRLIVTDRETGATVADSGKSNKQGMMPIRMTQ